MSGQITSTVDSSTISFDEIPYTILRPQTIVEVAPNYTNLGLVDFPVNAIVVGLMDTTGYASPNVTYQITRAGQAEALFGVSSMLTQMVNAWRLANNSTPLWAVAAVPPTGAVKATATVTFTSTALGSGTVPFYAGDQYVPLIVDYGETATAMATALAAAVNADASLPFVATTAAGVVTLTARTAGAHGNNFSFSALLLGNEQLSVPGVGPEITAFSGGAGTPDMTEIIAAFPTTWFNDLVTGFTDANSLSVLTAELVRRYAATGRLDMHAWYAQQSTVGQALAAGPAQNSQFMTRIAMISQSMPWQLAATLAAVSVFQLTNDPSRQLKTLALPGIIAPMLVNRPLDTDNELLLGNGWSTFDVLADGTVTIERVVTCYQVTNLGIPDDAWRDVMVPKTMTRIRYDWASYLGLQWPRAKLADDGSIAATYDPEIATPNRLQNSWAGRCNLYARLGWIENTPVTVAASKFVRNASDRNRVDSVLQVQQIGNLMVFAGRLEFLV